MTYGISLSGHTNILGPHFHHIEAFSRAVKNDSNLQGAVFYHHQNWEKISQKDSSIQTPDFLIVDLSSYEGLYSRMAKMFNDNVAEQTPAVLIDDIFNQGFTTVQEFAENSPLNIIGVAPIDSVYNGALTTVINKLAKQSAQDSELTLESFQPVIGKITNTDVDLDSRLSFDDSALARKESSKGLPPRYSTFG